MTSTSPGGSPVRKRDSPLSADSDQSGPVPITSSESSLTGKRDYPNPGITSGQRQDSISPESSPAKKRDCPFSANCGQAKPLLSTSDGIFSRSEMRTLRTLAQGCSEPSEDVQRKGESSSNELEKTEFTEAELKTFRALFQKFL